MPSSICLAASRTICCGGCHLAVLLVAAGLLIRSASLNAIGLMWSIFGLPFWLIYIFTDGEFTPTAALTHFGGLVIGIYGIRLLGMPRGSAGKALVAYLGLWALTRLVTPDSANVNLAFHVWPGWEDRFPSYPIYLDAPRERCAHVRDRRESVPAPSRRRPCD